MRAIDGNESEDFLREPALVGPVRKALPRMADQNVGRSDAVLRRSWVVDALLNPTIDGTAITPRIARSIVCADASGFGSGGLHEGPFDGETASARFQRPRWEILRLRSSGATACRPSRSFGREEMVMALSGHERRQ